MKAHVLNFHDVILILTSVEALFLSLVFRAVPSPQRQARTLLSILFLLLAGMLACNLVLWSPGINHLAINQGPFVPALFAVCVLMQGPTLYFYFKALPAEVELFRRGHALHLLPTLLVVTVILLYGMNGRDILPNADLEGNRRLAGNFIWGMIKSFPLVYVVAGIYLVVRMQRNARQLYSSVPVVEFQLANIVLMGFLAHWLWSFVNYVADEYLSDSTNDLIGIAHNYLAALLVNLLFAFGLINARQINISVQKPAKTLNPDRSDSIVAAIETAIHDKRLYLESDINLERFARDIGYSPKDVSFVINSHYHSNFFEFINGHRIEEAKRLLAAPEQREKTILDIIYMSGFNSQSAFHRFFKRLVNTTPSEYRKSARHKGSCTK